MLREPQIPLIDLMLCLSDAVDLVSPMVANHHRQVAYIAFRLGSELGLPNEERNDLLLAGAVHDIGVLSLQERLELLRYEQSQDSFRHATLGHALIKLFPPLARLAPLIHYHHLTWGSGRGAEVGGEQIPQGAHILHLADRVAVLIDTKEHILGQVRAICEKVRESSGTLFVPELVEVFLQLASREHFWCEASSPPLTRISHRVNLDSLELDGDGLLDLAKMFSHIIDFRSRFTATHSSGVAATTEVVARLAGFSERECRRAKIAGYLHDLGKLAVPNEILEKPGRLTESELHIMRTHPIYTYRVLERLDQLQDINAWASLHHERMDGKGYPFHLSRKDLPLLARVMGVADVFTAITEDRPYREGMSGAKSLKVLQDMAADSALDADIVALVATHFDEINAIRIAAQDASAEEYRNFHAAHS